MRLVLIVIVLLVLGFALYVRLAPTRAQRWHVAPDHADPGDKTTIGSFSHMRRGASAADLARLDQIIRATPRTKLIAGALDEGMLTYETRTALWGFPDYTTVQLEGDALRVFGRLRFGRGDLGVNAKRIQGWLQALDAGQGMTDQGA